MSQQHRHKPPVAVASIRPGEGTLLDVFSTPHVDPTGTSSTTFSIDIGSAPVPDRKYLADVCSVVNDRHTVRVLFGQSKIGEDELRSLLILTVGYGGAKRLVEALNEFKNPTLAEIVKTVGLQAEALPTIHREPSQTVALAANMTLAAVSGMDACLDFYQASAFAMSALQRGQKLAVEPVVRVQVRTGLFLGLEQQLREIVANPPAGVLTE